MRYLTTTEAASVLHVDPSRVRLLCKLGRIETIKIGNTYAIPEHELERFAALPRRAGRPRRNGANGQCQANHATASATATDVSVTRSALRPVKFSQR
jgi:excisionase family DNA binding protein